MSDPTLTELPAAEVQRLDAQFPARAVPLGEGVQVMVREAGAGDAALPLVCLHGIGSGAASWLDLAQALAPRTRVIAWDAPGYGASTPVAPASPRAADYGRRVHALLDALGIERCVLVGHSLGALMAAAAARDERAAQRFAALVLISPAQGYGGEAKAAQRERVLAERMSALDELGIAGMAAKRSQRLVSDGASPLARQWVRWNMARLNDGGYRQAIELLCNGELLADLPPALPVHVGCGALDVVTPPAGCAEVARQCGVPLQSIADAGHACYVERPQAVADWLSDVLAAAAR